MLTLRSLGRSVLRSLRDHLRPLIAYHLFFTLLASGLLLPGIAWTLTHLLERFERPILTRTELLDLLLSPGGVLWLLLAITLTFLVLYLQQAGMILVAVRRRDNHFRLAVVALWQTLHRLPSLVGLVVVQVGAHLLLVIPLALLLGWLYGVFLGGLDPYYVQQVRPLALWQYLAVAAPATLLWAFVAAGLYVRWILALPIVTLEQRAPLAALRRSHRLTHRRSRALTLAVLALLLVIVTLPLTASALFGRLFAPLLGWLPEHDAVLIPATLAYVTLHVLVTLAITFVGIAANALLSACLYLRLAHRKPHPAAPPAEAHPGRLAWAVELAVLLFAIAQAWWIVNSFELDDEVAIIAHRGSSLAAPENTLAAVERAIDDRADLVEIDARLTADGEVVLYHDRSLQRLIGDPRDLAELTLAELREFDVGSWFGDAFVGEPIPTLAETFAIARGRAALMIDMKPEPGQEVALAEAVIEALHREAALRHACRAMIAVPQSADHCGNPDVIGETRLAVAMPWLIEAIKLREPDLRITLLAQLIVPGTLERRGFEALGLRHNRITEEEIRLASHYGYELHAWTVNAPGQMSRMIDLGVDAIITDRPARLAALIDQRSELSDGELLLVKLRNWLAK